MFSLATVISSASVLADHLVPLGRITGGSIMSYFTGPEFLTILSNLFSGLANTLLATIFAAVFGGPIGS